MTKDEFKNFVLTEAKRVMSEGVPFVENKPVFIDGRNRGVATLLEPTLDDSSKIIESSIREMCEGHRKQAQAIGIPEYFTISGPRALKDYLVQTNKANISIGVDDPIWLTIFNQAPKIKPSDINEMVEEFKKMTSRLDLRSPMMESQEVVKDRTKKLYSYDRPSDDDR